MKRQSFNDDWTFYRQDITMGQKIVLPHDAMIHEKRETDGPGGSAHGYTGGREIGHSELHSATGRLRILVTPEEEEIKIGDIVYIPVSLVGENGVTESNADERLSVTVKGGTLLAFGSANPCTEENYDIGKFQTYQGHALAVVRAEAAGRIQITVGGSSIPETTAEVLVQSCNLDQKG